MLKEVMGYVETDIVDLFENIKRLTYQDYDDSKVFLGKKELLKLIDEHLIPNLEVIEEIIEG